MDEEKRPDPDSLLAIVKEQEERRRRGKLTVFLGYSAGVGKTYAMLEAARAQLAKGVDVAIGVVVTHGRADTEALAQGIERVPTLRIPYKGIELEEMDLDAILRRKPQIALVDELAHTNVPGSRNFKRYQDVLELINAGIDVYTTLNIQHIESINDVIEQITGVKVRETVPDTVLNDADYIKLVDITPDDFITRFNEGKVYVPDQASRAIKNFFNQGNLIALREISFRTAAEHTDEKMSEYLRTNAKKSTFVIREKFLVCIGDDAAVNEKLVHTGKRYSDETKTDWDVLYVECHKRDKSEGTISEGAMRGLELAKSLGANTDTTYGVSVVDEIIDYAGRNDITRIIVGNDERDSKFLDRGRSLSAEMLRSGTGCDIIVVDTGPAEERTEEKQDQYDEEGNLIDDSIHLSKMWKQAIVGTVAAVLCTLMNYGIAGYVDNWSACALIIALLVAVVCATQMPPIVAGYTALVSALLVDFFLWQPIYTFTVNDPLNFVSIVVFLLIGVIVSVLSSRARDGYIVEKRKYRFVSAEYELSSAMTSADTVEDVVKAMESHLRKAYGVISAYYVPRNGSLRMIRVSEGVTITSKEIMASKWVFKNGFPAGKYTDTLSSAEMKYYPMKVRGMTLGVVGVVLTPKDKSLRLEQEKIVQSFINEMALAIGRILSRVPDAIDMNDFHVDIPDDVKVE